MLSLYFAGAGGGPAAEARLEHAELFRAHDIESFDTGVARLRTGAGVALWFGASHACQTSLEPEIVITGTKGTACWRYESEASWTDAAGQAHRERLRDANGARRAMMAAALRRLHDRATAICTTEMAGRHTAVVESLHRVAAVSAFAPGSVSWSAGNGDATAIPSVQGLAEAMRRAYAAQITLAEAGFSSGVPAGRC
jgi:hypothetical protein